MNLEAVCLKISSKASIPDWYFDYSDHRCPHDAWLDSVDIVQRPLGERSEKSLSCICVKLLGAYHDGMIKLEYTGVVEYRICCLPKNIPADAIFNRADWIRDNFVFHSDYVSHEIFWEGYNWVIAARSVEYTWSPLTKK